MLVEIVLIVVAILLPGLMVGATAFPLASPTFIVGILLVIVGSTLPFRQRGKPKQKRD